MDRKHPIFYSWQSDTRPAANRTLIQNALELAVKVLKEENMATTINPVIDRDTSGVPGSPDISSTIFNKIDNSSVVVADVTLVDSGGNSRRFPNPNVLIEVGYAIKSLSFSRVLLVQNTFFGSIEDLPFDLRGKRVMKYSSDPDDKSRKNEKIILADQIKKALLAILPILEDTVEMDDSFDIQATSNTIMNIYQNPPENLETELTKISDQIISAKQTPPENQSYLLNQIVNLWKKKTPPTNKFLYDLSVKSVEIHPTSSGYFNKGFLAGKMGRPYDSISAYMKAIDLDYNNPSLCFLNAGNRYRELNELDIAISFYEKSVQLNPSQANAWFAAAQLHIQKGNISSAIRSYQGYLDWFNKLDEPLRKSIYIQQAEQAAIYVKVHKKDK